MTHVQPAVAGDLLPIPGGYRLRGDRCVVELSVRVLGVPVLRGRLTATNGEFHIGLAEHSGTLELRAASLRTGVPLLGKALTRERGLWATKHPVIRFSCERAALDDDRTLVLPGTVTVKGQRVPLRMSGTLHYSDPDRIVVWLRGRLRLGGAHRLTSRPVHVEVAAEFVR